ncbi:MAG: Tol-Pal system beta propeller repeat protein TolB [Alphaproteobacteria bacterium TMED62]|nr:MAG: Tol-Pal system beta propeller repeat protein TolB [Alphaproteobacteria bacterium TMED62]|tara:strand:+ start:542 stop:1864 length:1323 start_codon:yes stop_codon:yes gene_type:complete
MTTSKLYFIIFIFFIKNIHATPLEIDVTKGIIEPIPIAITKFNYKSVKEKLLSNKIFETISNDLNNSGLFRKISNKAFLQNEEEVFFQPLFKDWSLIDANLIISGKIKLSSEKLSLNIKLWDVYREKLILSKKIEGINNDNWRVLAHIVSNLIYERVTGEKGYFDTRLVYIAEEKNANKITKKIAIMDYDGYNHEYLTSGKNLVITPRFSPDGKKIAYLSFSKKKPTVYLLDIITKKEKILGNFLGMSFAPRFSPDGKKITFSLTQKGSSNIFIQDLDNNDIIQITKNRHINTSPSFSPDNEWLVFSSDRSGKQNLYIKKINNSITKKAKRISYGEGNYATPTWSPRGDYIAFTKTYRNEFYIGLMKQDGSDERIISKGYLTESPSWSPNGRTLVFNKIIKKNNNLVSSIFTIDITGNLEKKLVTPEEASDPDWGPSINY